MWCCMGDQPPVAQGLKGIHEISAYYDFSYLRRLEEKIFTYLLMVFFFFFLHSSFCVLYLLFLTVEKCAFFLDDFLLLITLLMFS